MIRSFSLLLLIVSCSLAHAQSPLLRFKSGETSLPAEIQWPPEEPAFAGYHYRLIQFDQIPDLNRQQQLTAQGVELLQYQPDLAYLVALRPQTQPNWAAFGVSRVVQMQGAWKRNPLDSWQESNGEVEARVLYHKNLPLSAVVQELQQRFPGVEILDQVAFIQTIDIRLDAGALSQLAALPFVSYVEPVPPPPVEENQHYRTGIHSNYLADTYGLDGSGMTLVVSEGRVNPDVLELKGRLNTSLHTGGISNHATTVGTYMAGAGNLDPTDEGMARGADVLSYSSAVINNAPNLYNNFNMRGANQSLGQGCNLGYNGNARAADIAIRNHPHFLMVYSTGNSQNSNCNYGAGPGWATITGGSKAGKNVVAVGALDRYDVIESFSSFGPTSDGRIKPDICAVGEGGTSYAAPSILGMYGQLFQAYLQFYGQEPPAGLMKAIMQNTAQDLGNPGPDFKYGYGKANGRRAYQVIENGTFQIDSLSQGNNKTITLTVPAGMQELKVFLYWTDVEGAANATIPLVNNLDLTLQDPAGTTFLPWILNPAPNATTLDQNAVRGADAMNNMEQVTLNNPAPGTYTITVDASSVPVGTQEWYVVTHMVPRELVVTYPIGGEGFVPGEQEVVRWDAAGTNTFNLEYSLDGGNSWTSMATNLPASQRHYEWSVPAGFTGDALFKVSSGSLNAQSKPFTVANIPDNLQVIWSCGDSAMIGWDPVPNADMYWLTRLGAKYMDSVSITNQTYAIVHGLSTIDDEWFAIQSMDQNGAISRRSLAFLKTAGDVNCFPTNAGASVSLSHPAGYYADCQIPAQLPLTAGFTNLGTSAISQIPVGYQFNGGPVVLDTLNQSLNSGNTAFFTFADSLSFPGTGNYQLTIWTQLPGDPISADDTLKLDIQVYPGTTIQAIYTQDFESFSLCSNAWGCSDMSCILSQGWANVPNGLGDSIDWRTFQGGTTSSGTGPTTDHTLGNASGKYLYLEGSGNGGSGCQNHEAFLLSPCLDLTGANQTQLSFWRHMRGSAIGELHIDVLADGVWYLDVADPVIGDQGNQWIQQLVDLSAFDGKLVTVRFRGSTGSGWAADMALDDIEITTLPRAAFSSSLQEICPGTTVNFTDASTYTDTWQWQFEPNTISFVGGTNANSPSPQVTFLQPGYYTARLIASNAFGVDTMELANHIFAGPHPLQLSLSDPDTSICAGTSFSVQASSTAGMYDFWLNDSLWQSGTANSLTLNNPLETTSISIYGELYPGCTTDTAVLDLQVSNPMVNLTATDGLTACEGESLELKATPGYAQYLWSDGGTDSVRSFTQNGTLTVTVTDAAGCTAQSNPLSLSFNPVPPKPGVLGTVFQLLGQTATYTATGQVGSSFTWGTSGGSIQTANPANFVQINWDTVGLFEIFLVETSADGCISDTTFIQVQVNDINSNLDDDFGSAWKVYPNPAEAVIFIEWEQEFGGETELLLWDARGRLIRRKRVKGAPPASWQIGDLSEGVYILEIRQGDKRGRKRLSIE
ncbi:MAG: S8 family serine peptidase [Bacteroidota bacterium]